MNDGLREVQAAPHCAPQSVSNHFTRRAAALTFQNDASGMVWPEAMVGAGGLGGGVLSNTTERNRLRIE